MVGPLVFAIEPAVIWGMGALGIGAAASIALKDADLSFPNEVRGACLFCHDNAESQTEVKQGTYDGPPPKDWSGAFPDKESNVLHNESTEGEDSDNLEEGQTVDENGRTHKPEEAEPEDGSLTNDEARDWYNDKVDDIDDTTELNEENVKNESDKRAKLKKEARDKMADQEARKKLDEDHPIRDYDYYKDKYTKPGKSEQDILQNIRDGAKKTNENVNSRWGKGKK